MAETVIWILERYHHRSRPPWTNETWSAGARETGSKRGAMRVHFSVRYLLADEGNRIPAINSRRRHFLQKKPEGEFEAQVSCLLNQKVQTQVNAGACRIRHPKVCVFSLDGLIRQLYCLSSPSMAYQSARTYVRIIQQ